MAILAGGSAPRRRQAFTQGLQVAATVSAAIILVAAILRGHVLRRAEKKTREHVARRVAVEPCTCRAPRRSCGAPR